MSDGDGRMSGGRGALGVLGAWAALSALWAVHVLEFGQGTVAHAAISGAIAMGTATLLALGVWLLSAHVAWSGGVTPRFAATHASLAAVYASAWILGGHLVSLLFFGQGTLAYLWRENLLGWRFWMGVLFYAVATALSYAIRTRRRLVEQEIRARQAEAMAAESRLRAVRAQMNPHFLFNALHSVGSLIESDPAGAQDAVERLGELLRYLLDDEDGEVLLGEEWEFTKNYLGIEGIRLGDRIAVESVVDDGVLSAPVPSFCVQTLVENAIRHGVSRSRRPGRVLVELQDRGGALVIRVTDNGPGNSAETVANSSGRGLRLMRERLDALYGKDATLELDTAPGVGSSAELRIPAACAQSPSPSAVRSAS